MNNLELEKIVIAVVAAYLGVLTNKGDSNWVCVHISCNFLPIIYGNV